MMDDKKQVSCMRRIISMICAAVLVTSVGCGTNVSMKGKVLFDDGTPLDMGLVIVENETFMARGEIKSDGSYTIGSVAERDGLPTGEYKVYITGAAKQVGTKPNGDPLRELLIEPKYSSPDTSELSVSIQKATKFDITVTKPAEPILR